MVSAAAVLAGGVAAVVVSGAYAGVIARYPESGVRRVSPSAEISAQLQVGWISARKTFDMVVTGPGGRIVRGRSTLDKAQALSFAPVRPLAAGKYTVEVHLHESPAEDTVLDSWSFAVKPSSTLSNGSGGSILLVAREGTRDTYVTEILRAEGFTGFDTVSPEHLSRDVLADHAIVILGPGVRRDRIFATWSRGSGAAVI